MSVTFERLLNQAKTIPINLGGPYQLGNDYVVLDKTAENAVLKSTFTILVGMVYDFELPNPGSSASRLCNMLRSYSDKSYMILRAFEAARSILIGSNPNVDSYRTLKQSFIDMLDGDEGTVAVMATVRPLIIDWLMNRNILSYAQCLQFFTFPGHLNVEGCLTYLQEGVSTLLEFEEQLKTNYEDAQYTTREAELFTEWFPRSKLELLIRYYEPVHGKGATAELSRVNASLRGKYLETSSTLTAFDLWITRHLDEQDAYLESSTIPAGNMTYIKDNMPRQYFGTIAENFPKFKWKYGLKTSKDLPPATGTMVPKSWKKGRGITKEATHRAFQQAGCRKAIRRFIRSELKNILLPHYTINDDSPNRELARLGSFEGDYATIDLSSASDSITQKMVEQWTKKSCLYEFCKFTRSDQLQLVWPSIQTNNKGFEYISYDPEDCEHRTIPAYKYAGMGNGTTFTIESIVFCAIVWAAIEESGGDPRRIKWLVWGDDIIIPIKYAEAVIKRLETNGFKVNKDKSFYQAPDYLGYYNGREMWNCYRESCGGEYLSGFDVTPVRVPRTFLGFSTEGACHTPESLATVLDLFNKFDSLQYPVVRRILLNEIMQHFVKLSDTRMVLSQKEPPFLVVEGPVELKKTTSTILKPKRVKGKFVLPVFSDYSSSNSMCLKVHNDGWSSNPRVRINGHNYSVGGTLIAKYSNEAACGPVPHKLREKYTELCRLNKSASDELKVHIFESLVHNNDPLCEETALFSYYESLHRLIRTSEKSFEWLASLDDGDKEPESMQSILDKWQQLQNAVGVRLNKPYVVTWEPHVAY